MTSPKTLLIANDHAATDFKKAVKEHFSQIEWTDFGVNSDESVDYPDFADEVARRVNENPSQMGILICGSGQGMAMRANKYPNVRAALCWSDEITQLSRQHNNANIIVLGSRVTSLDDGLRFIKIFLETEFEGGRHQRRVDKVGAPI